MDSGDAALICIANMMKNGRLHRQFSYRCRHPNDVALNERTEVEFQIDMPTYTSALDICIRFLAARQKVQLLQPIRERDCIWRVVIRPVMVPRPENVAGYRRILISEAAHFGGSVVHTTTLQPMPGYCGTMWRPSLTRV